MTITEMTREQLLDHAARCIACGACDTDLLTALETSPDGEVAEHVRLSHDRTWRSILRRALPARQA